MEKKMKYMLLVLAVLLSACNRNDDGTTLFTRKSCINGVVYYENGHKLAPAFKPNGTLFLCDMSEVNK